MTETKKFLKFIVHEKVHVGLREDRIIHVNFLPGTEINVEFQKELLQIFVELVKNKKSCIIYEGGEFVSVTKEARENAIKIEEQTPTLATVVVVKNLAQKLIADFYYLVNRPKRPYKVFWDFEKGIEWLKSFRDSDDEIIESNYLKNDKN